MTETIRRGVFETNSSSSHSLTTGPEGIRDMSLISDALKSGVLVVDIDDSFGWEWKRLYRPENKIAYLLSQAASLELENFRGDGRDVERLRRHSEAADTIIRAIEDHTGVAVHVRVNTEYPGVDHQSSGVGLELLENRQDMLDFIFGTDAYIQLGNDNVSAPAMCKTDLGDMREMYPHHYLDKTPRGLKVDLEGQFYSSGITSYIHRDKETLTSPKTFSALFGIRDYIKEFSVTKAEVTLYKPKDGHRIDDANMRKMAMNEIHRFLEHLNSVDNNTKISRDLDLKINVEQDPRNSYISSSPKIRLTGVMSAENIDLLKEGFRALHEKEKEKSRNDSPEP
jgi:hypothetical protein